MVRKVLAVGILLFLSQISFVTCGIYEPSNKKKDAICRSEACLKRGNLYFENLNPAVHPCEDFYSFACGTWYIHNKPPEHADEWTAYNVLEKKLFKSLEEILAKPANKSNPELVQVKYFYDICMKQPSYGRQRPQEVKNQILKVGRYKKKSLWDIHEGYLRLTGESPFFDYITFNLNAKELLPGLLLQAMISPYGAIIHEKWKPEEEKNYEKFLFVLMKSVNLPGTVDTTLKSKVKAVAKFRHQLNDFVAESRKRIQSGAEPQFMSLSEFQKWFKDLGAGNVKQLALPWDKIIKTILSVVPKNPSIFTGQMLAVKETGYFRALEKWLSLTPEEVLVDHLEMYFAERHTVFTDEMEDLLEKTAVEPTTLTDFIREDIPKSEICLRQHNMWTELGNIIEANTFKKDITGPMTELVNGLKLAIFSQVKQSTWLDEKTKADTIARINKVKPAIGHPLSYINIETDSSLKNPTQPEAYLNLKELIMYIKSPLLRSPFFNPDLPNVYNSATMGHIIGHEMYHAIHNCGAYGTSKSPVRWWSKEMHDRCKVQMKCFTESYTKETERQYKKAYHEPVELVDKDTYLEDYPDVMGLDAAFRLFMVTQKKDKNACQTLPRFEKYTCEQMFFIAFANTMCGMVPSKTAARKSIQTSLHSLDSVRVNGAVQHNPVFQNVFQCASGKPMSPAVKCNLWK